MPTTPAPDASAMPRIGRLDLEDITPMRVAVVRHALYSPWLLWWRWSR